MLKASLRGGWHELEFLTIVVIWGASYYFTHLALAAFGPLTIVASRMLIAAVSLGIVIVVRRVPFPSNVRFYLVTLILSITYVSIPYTLLTWGQSQLESSTAAILSSTTPLFVLPFASWLTGDDRADLRRIGGSLLAFLGVATVIGASPIEQHATPIIGSAAVLMASSLFALSSVLVRRLLRDEANLVFSMLVTLCSAVVLLPLISVFEGPTTHLWSWTAIGAVLWLGTLSSGLAYALYFRLLNAWGAVRTSQNTFLQPLVAIVLGAVWLGESLSTRMLVGTVITLLGVFIGTVSRPQE